MSRTICLHCRKNAVTRPRGLCWSDFYNLAVRALYPPGSANPATAKYARRAEVQDFNGAIRPAEAPTTAPPGTPEKLAVMEHRAQLRQAVFHEADSRWDGDPRPAEWLTEARSE